MMRSDILLVGQTPPPYHGQAVVTAMLFDNHWGDLQVERLRMSYSDTIDAVGKASLLKIVHLLRLIIETWFIVLSKRPRVLYYLPASANKVPVLRDVVYLCCVRWLFSKTVFHYHAGGLPEYLNSAGWLGKVAQKVYGGADMSIEICRTNYSPGRIFGARQTVFIANGLDVDLVDSSDDEGVSLRVLFLGALNEGKGVLDIVETAKILCKSSNEIEFFLVGAWASDEFRSEVEAIVSEYELGEIVKFPGPMQGADKWQAYADADLFIFPSHYQSENFPLVVIEALAFGLPVITTRWRGIPQLVGDSGAALMCDVNAPSQYADAVLSLKKDVSLCSQMSLAARRHYESYYTRETFVTAMENVFRSVLKA